MALNMVLTTIIGQCVGGKRTDRVKDYLKCALKYGSLFLFLLSAIIVSSSKYLSMLFVRSSDVASIGFDLLAAQAVRKAKKQHPDILLFYLRPYHPAERSFTPAGFDGSFYPPGMETVPRKLAIVRANRYMVDNSQFLIAYARYTVSNAWELTEYAMKRGKKGLIHVENLAQV